jgi:hypothetical protein
VEYISQKNYVFEEFIPQKLNIYGSFVWYLLSAVKEYQSLF